MERPRLPRLWVVAAALTGFVVVGDTGGGFDFGGDFGF